MSRLSELADALAAVKARIERAEAGAGRAPGSAVLIVVTKTFPASDVRALASLGVLDLGESREPEASAKAAECADLGLRWHQVGQVQTNKAAAVARWAHVVHSVDRMRLVSALAAGAAKAERPLTCFLQVSLDGDPSRAGAAPCDLAWLADAVASAEGLELAGLMAVAPADVDPRRPLEELVRLSGDLRRDHPQAKAISAGMSGDLEAAVEIGATHVRVGRAVLGGRPPLR